MWDPGGDHFDTVSYPRVNISFYIPHNDRAIGGGKGLRGVSKVLQKLSRKTLYATPDISHAFYLSPGEDNNKSALYTVGTMEMLEINNDIGASRWLLVKLFEW